MNLWQLLKPQQGVCQTLKNLENLEKSNILIQKKKNEVSYLFIL